MIVYISPDENPDDPGSVAADGTTERSLNLKVAYDLQSALERCGQVVRFDPTITYVERVRQANQAGADLLVACAHNESTAGLSGTQFVFCPGGQQFGRQAAAASAVYAQLALIPGWPPRHSDAVENVYECCVFGGDTVYTEYLYMSVDDQRMWAQPGYPLAAAEATARGLAAVYGFTYVPLGHVPPQAPTEYPPSGIRGRGQMLVTTWFNQLHVFYVDPAGALQHLVRWISPPPGQTTAWTGPEKLSGSTVLVPGALVSGELVGTVGEVFAPTQDGKVLHWGYDAGTAKVIGPEVLG